MKSSEKDLSEAQQGESILPLNRKKGTELWPFQPNFL